MIEHREPIPSRIYNAAVGGYVAGAEDIFDDAMNKDQSTINTETATALGGKLNSSEKGAVNGVASLDESGKVPTSQLPSYVDDVIEGYYYDNQFYSDSAHTQLITGESGKIYIDISITPVKQYRWSGSTYTPIENSDAVNTERERAMTVEANLNNAISQEVSNRTTQDAQLSGRITQNTTDIQTNTTNISNLRQLYNSLTQSDIIPSSSLPSSGQSNKIYRISENPNTSSYSDYMWTGSNFLLMATYTIDNSLSSSMQALLNKQNYYLGANVSADGYMYYGSSKILIVVKVSGNVLVKWKYSNKNGNYYVGEFDNKGKRLGSAAWSGVNGTNGYRSFTLSNNPSFIVAEFDSNIGVTYNPSLIVDGVEYFNQKIDNGEIKNINDALSGKGNYKPDSMYEYSAGRLTAKENWNSVLDYIPCNPGDTLVYNIGASTYSGGGLIFYNQNKEYLSYYAANNKSDDDSRTITVPNLAKYVRCSYYKLLTNNKSNLFPIILNGKPAIIPAQSFENGLEQRVLNLENGGAPIDSDYGIIGENYPEQILKIKRLNETVSISDYDTIMERFSFVHISDNHGSSFGYAPLLLNKSYANFLVNTGDLVTDKLSDGVGSTISQMNECNKPCYFTFGNHDYCIYEGDGLSKSDIYNTFMIPMNTHNNTSFDKTYYKVDYPNAKIKCIFLDQNDGWTNEELIGKGPTALTYKSKMSSEQINWFINELQDALTNDYHICCFIHLVPTSMEDCQEIPKFLDDRKSYYPYYNYSFLLDLIDAFIEGDSVTVTHNNNTYNVTFASKGHFIGWFGGHYHHDSCGYCKNYPKQLICHVTQPWFGSWNIDGTSKLYRKLSIHFNYVTIDASRKRVTILRIGDNNTKYGEIKDQFSVYYE